MTIEDKLSKLEYLEQAIDKRIGALDLEYSGIQEEIETLIKEYDEFEIITYSTKRDILDWRLEMVSKCILELKNLLK